MELNSLKIKNIQKKGKEILINLTEEQQDDAKKLYEIQTRYFLDIDDVWEYASNRIGNIVSAGKRYLNYYDNDVLDMIAMQDEILEKESCKDDIFLLEDILFFYYDVPHEKALKLIEDVDEKDREKNQIISTFIIEQLVNEIKETYATSKESAKKINTKMPKEKTEAKKSDFKM